MKRPQKLLAVLTAILGFVVVALLVVLIGGFALVYVGWTRQFDADQRAREEQAAAQEAGEQNTDPLERSPPSEQFRR